MNKKVLRDLLNSTEVNSILKINFLQDFKSFSGEYKVLSKRIGRGKAGSRIVSLLNVESGVEFNEALLNGKMKAMGTAFSEYILNIEVNGTIYGDETPFELPRAFARDAVEGKALRVQMEKLFHKEGSKVYIESSEPEFSGEWTISRVRFSPGRFGQVIANFRNDDSYKQIAIWSYRHSKIISSITLI